MPVRTKRLAKGNIGTAGVANVVYTCPGGETTIVKDVRVFTATIAITRAQVWVHSGPTNVRLVDRALSAQEAFGVMPWVVLQAGDEIRVQSSQQDALEFWISGAELEGVAD